MSPNSSKESLNITSTPEATPNDTDYPKFDPENARKLQEETKNTAEVEETDPRYRFRVDRKDYPLFSRQMGDVVDEVTGATGKGILSIDETLGLMVGRTAELIGTLNGETENFGPKIDHVIYLDKSARPVSWMVDEFWDDFSSAERPKKDYLAIDRHVWFDKVGIELKMNEYIEEPDGSERVATANDFKKAFEGMSDNDRLDWLARIRGLFIADGIEDEDPEKILSTPTVLDGKNVLLVDEVSRSGSTLGIASYLLEQAINYGKDKNDPNRLKSLSGFVFWEDGTRQVNSGNGAGETQMGEPPVWYRRGGQNDWIGRGVKDIDPRFYLNEYMANPNNHTRALNYGSFVLGVPMSERDLDEEPGQVSRELANEMKKMHNDYEKGHILPTIPYRAPMGEAFDKMEAKLHEWGVVTGPEDKIKNNPNSYHKLIRIRNRHKKPRREAGK